MTKVIQSDADIAPSEDQSLDEAGAIAAFMNLSAVREDEPAEEADESEAEAEETSDTPDEADDTEDQADAEGDSEEDNADPDEESDEKETYLAEDDDVVQIKIGDKVVEASVKDLKRLYGQEKVLTQKSQRAAEQVRQAEAREAKAAEALERLHGEAKQKLAEYEGIDLLKLAASGQYTEKQLSEAREYIDNLRKEVGFYEESLDSFNSRKQERILAEAEENLRVMSDPSSPMFIEGLKERYTELNSFAQKIGIPEDVLETNSSPWLWKLIDTNLRFSKAQEKLSNPKTKTAQKEKNRRVLKSRRAERSQNAGKSQKGAAAVRRLSETGSIEDATAAFMALG